MTTFEAAPVHSWKDKGKGSRLFVTDFDGTLARSDRTVAEADLRALRALGREGVVRVIATGRSLYSFQKAAPWPMPIDFVLFSTGGGVVTSPEGMLIYKAGLTAEESGEAAAVLLEEGFDFMVHDPVPENHCFSCHGKGEGNPDFTKRLELYPGCFRPFDPHAPHAAAQLLVILPPGADPRPVELLKKRLPRYTVVRTTSPLSGSCTWIEIFPREVSKSQTTRWLAQALGISSKKVCAVGNDYNDADLLEWSGTSYVVANAPAELKERFEITASNEACGVSEAIQKWKEATFS